MILSTSYSSSIDRQSFVYLSCDQNNYIGLASDHDQLPKRSECGKLTLKGPSKLIQSLITLNDILFM